MLLLTRGPIDWLSFLTSSRDQGAPDEVILLWRSSILLLDRFDDDGDFEEYQQSLMLTMFPPPTAPADVPSMSGSIPNDPMGHPCELELHVPVVWEHEDHDDGPISGPLFEATMGAVVEVPRLIRMLLRLIMMMIVVLLQLREEDMFDADA
uniref:Uncharacterized protein n=1 Tax=Fagus sylvatica TaxID=28930 RepID=A0A2N9JBU0_FAGSY